MHPEQRLAAAGDRTDLRMNVAAHGLVLLERGQMVEPGETRVEIEIGPPALQVLERLQRIEIDGISDDTERSKVGDLRESHRQSPAKAEFYGGPRQGRRAPDARHAPGRQIGREPSG